MPFRTDDLELHGKYQGSGYAESVFIARRGDGQVVHLSELLHLVAVAIDGKRDVEQIAREVTLSFGQEVSADNIAYLVTNKLEPMGITAAPGTGTALAKDVPRSDLLLGLVGRRTLVPPRAVAAAARMLAWLHRPPAVGLVLLGLAALDGWLFLVHGAVPALLGALDEPLLLLAVFGLVVASLVFHEFGHASACHYGGARPGRIGCGIYLLWPSLYTDVTDVYRISRAGRLRTDLGGVYFNVVFMLALAAAYAGTGWSFLLAAIYLGHFEIFEQLVPAARLDGYYILADIAGVPDLYGQIGPILRGVLPGRKPGPAVATTLTRKARTTIAVWMLVVLPLMITDLGYTLWNLPRISATAARSVAAQAQGAYAAAVHGDISGCAVAFTGLVLLAFPLIGIGCLLARLVRRLVRTAHTATAGRPRTRAALASVALAAVMSTASAWAAGVTPEPLPPSRSSALPFTHLAVPAPPRPSPAPRSTARRVTRPTPGPSHPGLCGGRKPPCPRAAPTVVPSSAKPAPSSARATPSPVPHPPTSAGLPSASGPAATPVASPSPSEPPVDNSPAPSPSSRRGHRGGGRGPSPTAPRPRPVQG
ncbi:hypothetical protein [Streptomyces sp. NPDC001828]|uniref:hypothetical protein n=1 Tax=Streptomyces sp. NPDC001828 TaxID=3364615 RepID=UPI0036C3D472